MSSTMRIDCAMPVATARPTITTARCENHFTVVWSRRADTETSTTSPPNHVETTAT